MQGVDVLKLVFGLIVFTQIMLFGRVITRLSCFKNSQIIAVAMTFSGSLFLSIALTDIIPEAIEKFDRHYSEIKSFSTTKSALHSISTMPLTMFISMSTFMLIMLIDKILVRHSHDDFETSLSNQPKESMAKHIITELEMVSPNKNARDQDKENADNNPGRIERQSSQEEKDARQSEELKLDAFDSRPVLLSSSNSSTNTNYRPFILQAGMSIHAFFECLAVGLQGTSMGVVGLAAAIVVHKWAEGLTLGLIYEKDGFQSKTVTCMIGLQAIINILGLIGGTILTGHGDFVVAFFMSVSAGTFLYISLAQILTEQLVNFGKAKACAMLVANTFLIFIVGLEALEVDDD